ncbi:MAG TPA: hypothetical protein VK255_04165, partial [Patescibacteria group bacterium]|nr:hypothetical protein [Patescibacteria group bacterium]
MMIKKIFKMIKWTLGITFCLIVLLLIYFNIPVSSVNKNAELGVTFSSKYASDIRLDWKEAYLAMLDDLQVKKIRIPLYWDVIEKKEGVYDFSDIRWQLDEAKKHKADVIVAIGQKVPRWPECFIPAWTQNDETKRKSSLLKFINKSVEELKGYDNVY